MTGSRTSDFSSSAPTRRLPRQAGKGIAGVPLGAGRGDDRGRVAGGKYRRVMFFL